LGSIYGSAHVTEEKPDRRTSSAKTTMSSIVFAELAEISLLAGA
jgi:hypothetical protein